MASRGRFLFAKAAEMQFIDVLLVTLVGVGLTAGTTFSGVGTTTESGKQAEADICTLSPMAPNETKSCLAFLVKYTYNATEGKCMTYVYGGCGGTANLFDSEAQCIAACPKKDAILQDSVDEGTESKDSKEACNQPLSSGPCFGFFRKFGFNSETGRCEWFVYGGCQGNANNFNSARKCQDTCGGSEPLTG
ncbi:unnamed protein product [Notodromas monacha]|uniref:BPTI/Kunitz inhibitor domain-containing protein n=1 Tax=Notodromas monacha TaxID=399045 RepID=A0A7R9GA59_9CRUS|nr:unnamed protein product [Notodromas monacha]CAG0914995.1 unnamed protein product [Notodromas monacha]